MRIIIIGAVAAGTSAAAKARRNNEEAEIVIYEKDSYVSYSGCGMPYYISGDIENASELFPRDPAFFKSKYNVDIFTFHEVLDINTEKKSVIVKNLNTGEEFTDSYDRLVIATGASPVLPPIKGADKNHVFHLRNINDMHHINEYIEKEQPKTAVIVGTGFIGLELCESFVKLGMQVTLIEKLPQVTPGLDPDMAVYLKAYLQKRGIKILAGESAEEITDDKVIVSDGSEFSANIVILSIGVRPNTGLAKNAGIELGIAGAIRVDSKMKTNKDDVYACGDCIEQFSLITGKPIYRPLGSTANKTGRIAGDNITGGNLDFRGILGTGIFRIFDMTVAQTGLSEREAMEQGYDVVVCHNIKPNKPEYFGGKEMVIKAIADKATGKLLGVQIIGYEGVDKRIDVFVTAITLGAKAEDLFHLDLAYAPPFSTTKDPIMYTGMILDNAIHNGRPLMTASQLDQLINSGQKYNLIDARVVAQYDKEHIETASSIPHSKLRTDSKELDKGAVTITYCNKGVTGNAAQNILRNKGFQEVYNLSGGFKQFNQQKDIL